MSPNTKSKIKYSRRVQLALRVLELVGATGLLFCVIAIKGTSGSLGWIIRIAPAVGLLHTLYAVYHLCRSATGRTAASSASYMLFAAMIDAGLLPFLAFSAFMAHNEHTSGTYGWDTLFGVPLTTFYIVYSTFLLCVIEGGLLLLSLILGIYLAIIFRKIAKLPADMNPLEPNLTTRPHKRNKSEVTTSDKHMSQTSLVSNNRMSSTAEPLIAPGRRVPFMHTRTHSADSIPLYPNNGERSSRLGPPRPASFYHQPNHSSRGSYLPIDKSLPSPPSRPQSAMAPSFSSRQAGTSLDHRPVRSSLLAHEDNSGQIPSQNGRLSPLETYHQRTTVPGHVQVPPFNDENIPPNSPDSSRASTPDPDRDSEYMDIKNWYESPHIKIKRSRDYAPIHQQQQRDPPTATQKARHERKGSLYDFDRDVRSPSPQTNQENEGQRNPLGMNPPSPALLEHEQQPQEQHHSAVNGSEEEPRRYALYDAPVNVPTPTQRPKVASRPSSFVGSGSNGRYYGELRSLVGSVTRKSEKDEIKSDTASNYSRGVDSERTATMDSGNEILAIDAGQSWTSGDAGVDKSQVGSVSRYSDLDDEGQWERNGENENDLESDRTGRVVSNTGHDLSAGYAGLGAEFGRGMGRRREVSGKVVEEGRAGHPYAGRDAFEYDAHARQGEAAVTTAARTNGNAITITNTNANRTGMAAAGWARFKGL